MRAGSRQAGLTGGRQAGWLWRGRHDQGSI